MSSYMSRLFPRSNSSFLLSSGNALKAQVSPIRQDMFLVEPGIGAPRLCKQDELTRVPPSTTTSAFENAVGFLGVAGGAQSHVPEKALERLFVDVVAGEPQMKERAISRFNEMVGSADTAAQGEPILLLPKRFRQYRVCMELQEIWRKEGKVKGFILQRLRGGYAVGIAGYIAYFQPRGRLDRRSDRFSISTPPSPASVTGGGGGGKRSNFVVL